ncbi:hypothetical protein [Spirillospora sp. CA-294931]|uniref:hypothetical protein n=1 Tax=Spirillospora sp. CA-294931 TaxID=3240042 RepID=UPI003D8A2442
MTEADLAIDKVTEPRARPGRETRAATGRAASFGDAFRAALPAWVLTRVVTVLAVWAVGPRDWALPTGERIDKYGWFFAWDGAWYRQIAEYGHDATGTQGVRFFPLLPLTDRVLADATGLPVPVVQAVVTSACALGLGMALYALVVRETGNRTIARRAAWLVQLIPGAYVLTLGYTEAPAGLLGVLFFLALRTSRFSLAIVPGFLSGLARPTGVLFVLPGLVEAWRALRSGAGPRKVTASLVAAASPALGLGSYLLWTKYTYGNLMLPFEVAQRPELRGGVLNNPLPYLFKTMPIGFDWQFQLIVIVAALVMTWIVIRRLPASYTVWTLAGVGTALTSQYLWSAPRYLGQVFPLAIAAAMVTVDWRRFAWVVGACLPLFYYLLYLSFTGKIAP